MKNQNLQLSSESQRTNVSKISLISAIFFAGIAGYSYFAFLPLLLNSRGFSAGEITFIMTWMGVGMAIFSWFFGRLSDKTGYRKSFVAIGLLCQVIIFSLITSQFKGHFKRSPPGQCCILYIIYKLVLDS